MFLYMFDWARPAAGSRAASETTKGARASQKEKTVKWIALKWRLEEKQLNLI
jgi:hypothetical protein